MVKYKTEENLMDAKQLYQADYNAWCILHIQLMQNKDYKNMDWDHLTEEMINMVGNNEGELISRMMQLYIHILKWIYQPEKRTRSWKNSIQNQRIDIDEVIERNPSLQSCMFMCSVKAYKHARKKAAIETGIDKKGFPEQMPFFMEDALKEEWFPE